MYKVSGIGSDKVSACKGGQYCAASRSSSGTAINNGNLTSTLKLDVELEL
jgi:hypothetical protein